MRLNFLPSFCLAGAITVLAVSPVRSQIVQVTGVRLQPTEKGVEVILETPNGASLQTFTTTAEKSLIINIPNAELSLPERREFSATNPAKGISSITVNQADPNSIRITLTGETAVPQAEVTPKQQGLLVNVTSPAQTAQAPFTEEEIELVVTATRTAEEIADIPRSVTIINRQQIEQQQNVARDLQDILGQLVPGLGPPSQLYTSFGQTLRGRAPQVLVDGVPISTNLSTAFARDLRTIDPSAVERVEIVRGPSAIYGDGAAGGVINIITRRATQERFTATSNVGFNFSATHPSDSFGFDLQQLISGREGQFDYTLGVSLKGTNGFFDAEGDRIPLADSGGEESITFNVLAKAGIDFTPDQRLQFTLNYYRDTQNVLFISDPAVDDIPGRQKARDIERDLVFIGTEGPANLNTVMSLNYTHNNLFGSKLAAQAYYRDTVNRAMYFDSRLFDPESLVDVARSRQETQRLGGRLQFETPITRSFNVVWGADYVNEDIEQPFDIFNTEEFDNSGGRILRKIREGTFTPSYQVRNLGLFAQLKWEANEQFVLSGGVRHERIGLNVDDYTLAETNEAVQGGELNFSATVFNIGAVYKFTKEFNIFANFAQGFSVPDFGRILRRPPGGFVAVTNGLRLLEPIKIDNYEIGLRGDWRNIQASISGFYNTSELGASLRVDDLGFVQAVRAPQRNYGVEVTFDYQPGGGWQFGSTLSYVFGENDEDEDGDFKALNSADIPPIKVTAYLQHQTTERWLNRLQLLYVGSRNAGFRSGADALPIESYFVVDYISNIKVGPGQLQIGVQNLFNNQYATVTNQWIGSYGDSYYLTAPGTTVSVSYRFNW